MINAFYLNTDEIRLENHYQKASSIFSKNEYVIWKNITCEKRAAAFFIGHILLRLILLEKSKIEHSSDLTIEYGPYGKPYSSNDKTIFFNISHSYSLIVVAYSNHSFGIDVQKKVEFSDALLNRMFNFPLHELNKLGKHKAYLITTCWSIRESIGKANGSGLTFPFKKMSQQDIELIISRSEKSIFDYHVHTKLISNNYSLVAASKKKSTFHLIKLSKSETLDKFEKLFATL